MWNHEHKCSMFPGFYLITYKGLAIRLFIPLSFNWETSLRASYKNEPIELGLESQTTFWLLLKELMERFGITPYSSNNAAPLSL